MITPNQIREKTISTVEGGGYDRTEVNELLLEVIESYEAVYNENKELYRKMEILANRIEEYRSDEDSIKTALISAQKMASQVVNEAKEKADKAISESASSAQQTVLDAKEKAEKIIGEARDYVANLTQEKEDAAGAIISDAEKKANDAIDGAKVVAQNVLDKAKTLSTELVEKARAERVHNEELVSKLKVESKGFKENLISLYETQLTKLKNIAEHDHEIDNDEENIESIENELNELIASIDDIIPPQEDDDTAEVEETAVEEKSESVEENNDVEKTEEVDETEELDEELDEVDSIIGQIESMEPIEFDDEDIEDEAEEITDVEEALDAFSSDEITPISDDAPSIPVIEDEPEFESAMPFEDFFNVNNNDPRDTDETISLIPPEDEENEEEDTSKFKGFFKKKK